MKIIYSLFSFFLSALFLSSCACHGDRNPVIERAHATKLASPFPVYVKDHVVINHPNPGFEKKLLPTDNTYGLNPGCYIICYSRDSQGSVYGIGNGMYVKGMIRVGGLYIKRICHPAGYIYKDISAESYFKNLCRKRIASCGNSCWAGGDSGGWFGIQ